MSEHIGAAQKLFDADEAKCGLEDALKSAGVPFESIGWDWYDCSIELFGIPAEYRLSTSGQRVIHEAGFAKAYLNHTDRWETHFSFKPTFEESKGWRVSYPHKRGENETGIWVEEVVTTWPNEWFETGYVTVKPAPSSMTGG